MNNECTAGFIIFVSVILLFAIIAASIFCGTFESFIVKQCTNCGRDGKTRAVSNYYSIIGNCFPNKFRGLKHYKLGVLHHYHFCKKCFDDYFKWCDKVYWSKGGEG